MSVKEPKDQSIHFRMTRSEMKELEIIEEFEKEVKNKYE